MNSTGFWLDLVSRLKINLTMECNHSAENQCVVVINLKKTSCFSCLCCLRNVTRLLNLSSARQIWNDDAVKCERCVTRTLPGEGARGAAGSPCSSWRVGTVSSGWRWRPRPFLWRWYAPGSWDLPSPASLAPASAWLKTSQCASAWGGSPGWCSGWGEECHKEMGGATYQIV